MVTFDPAAFRSRNERLTRKALALFTGCYRDDVALVRRSLQGTIFSRPAEVNIRADCYPYGQLTPLHVAAGNSGCAVVQHLVFRGADVNASADKGGPLHYAIEKGSYEIVQLLVASGSDADHDALYTAIDCGKADVVALFLAHGTHASISDLHHALSYAHAPYDVGRCLIAQGVDVNAKCAHGFGSYDSRDSTLLHHWAATTRTDVVSFLLSAGADVTAKDGEHKTPLDIAIKARCNDNATLLLTAGGAAASDCKSGVHMLTRWIKVDDTRHERRCLVCSRQERADHHFQHSQCVDFPFCSDHCVRESFCAECDLHITAQ